MAAGRAVRSPVTRDSGSLTGRILAVGALRAAYQPATAAGAIALFACGGFVAVLRRWLADEIRLGDLSAVVATLGGVWPAAKSDLGDLDIGLVLERHEVDGLYQEIEALARPLGALLPGPPRLTFLPCCGVVAGSRRVRALVIGLPLIQVLTRGEIRAVLAHELAHLARGDAARVARATRFVERLEDGLDDETPLGACRGGPLRAWARWSFRCGAGLVAPLARAQEERADRIAAGLVGGDAAASALMKVALVQSIFREVLAHQEGARKPGSNLYATFRTLWDRLPAETLTAMRHALLADRRGASVTHPRLIDRLAVVQRYPARRMPDADLPASTLVADLEALEELLHHRLYALDRPQASVFHRAGS